MQKGLKNLDFRNFLWIHFKISFVLFFFFKVSSHRYEAPSDAIEVISPASSPAPPQDKLQAYQPEIVKANQAESMSFLATTYMFPYLHFSFASIMCLDHVCFRVICF
jgi:hypothetical protein